jgi:glycosyltransferase involved in cell wall biosynthesis
MDSMSEHLVLIFAYHFPPENVIGGTRPFRFAKYLSRRGYAYQVFTAAEQVGHDDGRVRYILDPFLTASRRSLGWQIERVIRKAFLPGALGLGWSYAATRAARLWLRSQPHTSVTIFSTYPPLGSHFAAWRLARSTGLRWIADFRDPMPNDLPYGLANHLQKRIDYLLERIFLRRADAVIANTEHAMLKLREKFPSVKTKVHTIWNGFDPEEHITPTALPRGDCRVLIHAGELYAGRNATPILESIARLVAVHRLPLKGIRVRLIGEMEPGTLPNKDFLDRGLQQGWLELIPRRVPKSEALQLARSSNFLLLLQPQSSIQVPGKLFEYLQIGRPILAFVPRDSASERLLMQSGVPFRCIYVDSTTEMIDRIVEEFFALPSTAVPANSWFREQFSADNQASQLASIICALHNA